MSKQRWLKSCMGTLWLLRFFRSTYIWALIPAKLINPHCFHNDHHSNHFLPKNFYGSKKIKFDHVLVVQERCWLKSSVTMLKYLSLGVHYGKWNLKWLKSLHGCSFPLWYGCTLYEVLLYITRQNLYTWSFHWYMIHMPVNIIGALLRP